MATGSRRPIAATAHWIANRVDAGEMMAGKATGARRGKGGPMRIAALGKGIIGTNGILGAGAPLICGAGIAAKFPSFAATAGSA